MAVVRFGLTINTDCTLPQSELNIWPHSANYSQIPGYLLGSGT